MNTLEDLKNEFPRLEENISLKKYSTFRIGGPSKYFFRTSEKKELQKIIEMAINIGLPFHVLGGGSNTLISDNGFDGLVIVYTIKDPLKENIIIDKNKNSDGSYSININAATPLNLVINKLNDFTGLEWAIGIPGTLGGAVNGNAGAFNQSISDNIESVSVLDISNGEIKEFKNEECFFSYRSSIFKSNSNLIILSGILRMETGDEKEIKKRMNDNISKRKEKLPFGFSIGSIFKNYEGNIDESLFEKYPELNNFKNKEVIPVGFLIESCGLKGKIIGGAKISDEHANIIINFENASSNNVIDLINLIKKLVKEKFLIDLEEEIKFLGDFTIDKKLN